MIYAFEMGDSANWLIKAGFCRENCVSLNSESQIWNSLIKETRAHGVLAGDINKIKGHLKDSSPKNTQKTEKRNCPFK